MWRLFAFLALSIMIAETAYAQNYGLPTVPGETKTPTSISSLNRGVSMFVDWSDPNSIQINLGADPDTIKLYVRSNSLSAGSTDADADALQRSADFSPLLYAFAVLAGRAQDGWQKLHADEPEESIHFNLIFRTINSDNTLQDHLIESFTCTYETTSLCDVGDFSKLPDFVNPPWFEEAIDDEALKRKRAHS